ncbi:MAG: flagellar hook-basal body complex protein [Candidatus Kryptonium sp.]|nr:flagellar hook-basal body complex protein [Candidatus Kryptonium sp.]MDW8108443.1 flagellar hook-basal body complex protein [Candidatus Kryptonium sp.]
MSFLRSLFSGVSGLRNHQVMMDVIGNNISNINTIGFKSARVSFSETFAQTLRGATQPSAESGGTNPLQVGLGMNISSIDTIFTQGNLETTGQVTDLAIQGNGFFIVKKGGKNYFTRAGAFRFDANGNLVDSATGAIVQGKMADASGVVPPGAKLEDIKIPFGQKSPAKATSVIKLTGNLNAGGIPKGNILRSARLYAVEDGNSDVNNLLATGTANTVITGMLSGSTTVTIQDGTKVRTYTYVSKDGGVGDGNFHTLNDLIAEINNDFAGSLSASIDSEGRIVLRSSSNQSVVISSNNRNFESALSGLNGSYTAGSSKFSDEFSHVARPNDLLTKLRDAQGNDLGLVAGDTITIAGKVGGKAITAVNFSVSPTSTYKDFADAIKNAFRISNPKGVVIDLDTGALVVNADGGKSYEITELNISSTGRDRFNSIFENRPGNWLEVQKAEDVEASTTVTVYDSLGNKHNITLKFVKDATTPNQWSWTASVSGKEVIIAGGSGKIVFNSDGSIRSFFFDDGSSTLRLDPGDNSADILDIVIDPGKIGEFAGITQMEGPSSLIADQNGYGLGFLNTISVNEDGKILGVFSNGTVRVLAQILVATFNNPSGLLRVGDNMFDISANSGTPIIDEPGSAIQSKVMSGVLEQSNVDLAEEFTRMIIAQRGFQANARIITTSDEFLQEIVNLKR